MSISVVCLNVLRPSTLFCAVALAIIHVRADLFQNLDFEEARTSTVKVSVPNGG